MSYTEEWAKAQADQILAYQADNVRLQAELASAHEELAECKRQYLDCADENERLRAEPPRPAAIVVLKDPLEFHGFEDFQEAYSFQLESHRLTSVVRLRDDGIPWIWHPTKDTPCDP